MGSLLCDGRAGDDLYRQVLSRLVASWAFAVGEDAETRSSWLIEGGGFRLSGTGVEGKSHVMIPGCMTCRDRQRPGPVWLWSAQPDT